MCVCIIHNAYLLPAMDSYNHTYWVTTVVLSIYTRVVNVSGLNQSGNDNENNVTALFLSVFCTLYSR